VLAAVLVGCGVALAVSSGRGQSGPAAIVLDYFAALRRSDASAALGFGALPRGARTFLTSAVLGEQQRIAPISDVSVLAVHRHGARAVVRVRYALGFAQGPRFVTSRLRMQRGTDWRVAAVATRVRVRVATAAQRATLAGARLPRRPVLLFPGAVPVRFDTPYLDVGPSAGVRIGASSVAVVRPSVSTAGRLAVVAAVSAALRRCLGAHGASPACPVPPGRFVPGGLRGRVLGPLASGLRIRLLRSPLGVLGIAGRASVRARYRRLTFRDQMVTGRGRLTLPITARAYAVAPLRLHWTAA
jgi:hypothetical protein